MALGFISRRRSNMRRYSPEAASNRTPPASSVDCRRSIPSVTACDPQRTFVCLAVNMKDVMSRITPIQFCFLIGSTHSYLIVCVK